jgi:hypothetical protein
MALSSKQKVHNGLMRVRVPLRSPFFLAVCRINKPVLDFRNEICFNIDMNDSYEKHKNDPKNIASLLYWRDGISVEEVNRIIANLKGRGLVTHSNTEEYIDAMGGPVLYFP